MIPKFRIWDKYTNAMFDVKAINYHLKAVYGLNTEYIEYNQKTFPFKDYPIMQSTGMFDKNGKEIYEGDVVEIRKYDGLFDALMSLPFRYKGVVDFNKGKWEIIIEKERIPLFSEYKGIEVIGHKYMEDYKEFLNE